MIIKNKFFIISVFLVLMQQFLLAISTYFIGMAGNNILHSTNRQTLFYITMFFIAAVLSYLSSSFVEYFKVRLKNNLWEKYTLSTFSSIEFDMSRAINKNKQLTNNWLTGEAPLAFEDISIFIIDLISIYLNVILTFIVFGFVLGYMITGAMALSIFFSILAVKISKNYIAKLTSSIQSSRLLTLISINDLWDNFLFANKKFSVLASQRFSEKAQKYFNYTREYVVLEQAVSCLPVCAAVFILICMLYYLSNTNEIIIGGILAVLPRSLQLFGNVHSLSMYQSKAIMIKSKLNNLKIFTQNLEKQELLSQIKSSQIKIINVDNDKNFTINQLLEDMSNNVLDKGRFLITGDNGSGKTSLLKLIKSKFIDSILVNPDTFFIEYDAVGSTGEKKVQQIDFILSQENTILLLDEWDANLDARNAEIINNKLQMISRQCLIIEVRHNYVRNYSTLFVK